MPFLSSNESPLTTVVTNNILEGKFNRVLQEASKVTVAMTASLVSAFATVIVGRELLVDGQEIPDTAATPRNPEDILAQTVGRAGEEIIIGTRNGNAATNNIRAHVYIEPI